jgi:hypothetical protein
LPYYRGCPAWQGDSFLFKRTSFDFLLLIFLLTAVVGVWAAYDREAALAKFWLLVAGILLFYALARQPQDNLWLVAGLISAFGAGVAAFFLLTHDWQANPAKIGLIQQAAVWWMGIRPDFLNGNIHHNTAGGMMAITAPFLIALGTCAWRGKKMLLGLWVLLAGCLMQLGCSSQPPGVPGLVCAAGLGVWLLWVLSGKLAHRTHRDAYTLFGIGAALSCILVLALAVSFPGGMLALAGELPGPDSAEGRIDIAQAL